MNGRAGKKETRILIRRLESQGCEVRCAGGHYKVYRDGRYLATLAGTASDWRSHRNAVALLRRLGLAL